MKLTAIASILIVCSRAGKQCDLRIINAKTGKLQSEGFNRRFRGDGKRPVVFRNLTFSWPAKKLWADKKSFIRRHGDLEAPLREQLIAKYDFRNGDISIEEYLTKKNYRDQLLFDFGNLTLYKALRPDYIPVPDALRRLNYLPAFTLGHNGTGSGGHRHEENWLAQVSGRKMWILAAPFADAPSDEVLPCELLERKHEWPPGVVTCLVDAGEVIYLPNTWWHATCNLDDFTVAVGGKGSTWDWPEFMYDIQAGDLEKLRTAAKSTDVTKAIVVQPSRGEKEVHFALHLAVEAGSLDILRFLLDQRADPSERTQVENKAMSLVSLAAQSGKLDILRYLLQHGLGNVSEEEDGYQVLHLTAEQGMLEPIKILLSARADASAVSSDEKKVQPLHLASLGNSPAVISTLVGHRADVNAKDAFGQPPFFWALAKRAHAALQALVDQGARLDEKSPQDGTSVLHKVAAMGHVDILDLLLDNKLEVDALDHGSSPALHYAAAHGHKECVQLLIRRRASVQLPEATSIALQAGYKAVAKFISSRRSEL